MPSLETVEIHSLKDASEKWIINRMDFDDSLHRLWGSPEPEPDPMPRREVPEPAVEDFETDDAGNVVAVMIINPNNQRARVRLPIADYNPDEHRLWSQHPRFQRQD